MGFFEFLDGMQSCDADVFFVLFLRFSPPVIFASYSDGKRRRKQHDQRAGGKIHWDADMISG